MADPTITPQDTGPTFFSGWRPLLGWIILTALALNFVVAPTVRIVAAILKYPVDIPTIDESSITTLCASVLSLGGLRTFEKWTGVHNQH